MCLNFYCISSNWMASLCCFSNYWIPFIFLQRHFQLWTRWKFSKDVIHISFSLFFKATFSLLCTLWLQTYGITRNGGPCILTIKKSSLQCDDEKNPTAHKNPAINLEWILLLNSTDFTYISYLSVRFLKV